MKQELISLTTMILESEYHIRVVSTDIKVSPGKSKGLDYVINIIPYAMRTKKNLKEVTDTVVRNINLCTPEPVGKF